MGKSNESTTVQALYHVFSSDNCRSWRKLNHALWQTLNIALTLNYEIRVGDWDLIYRMRYNHWGCTSENGHHMGEPHYKIACQNHRPAAIEYERFYRRKPFILNGKRLYDGSEVYFDGLYWRVTGWTRENDAINLVGYQNRKSESKRKLKKIHFKEWQSLRKEVRHV